MKFYSIGQFSKQIGKTEQTLRNWDKNGTLRPHHITKSGYRYYSQEQLDHFFGLKNNKKPIQRKVIGYCRVNSSKEKDELQQQIDYIKTYMYAKGYQFEIISEIGSGVDYNRKKLNQLIYCITNSEIEKVVVLNKERLLTIGFELIENLCSQYNTKIEIIDSTKIVQKQELIKDFLEITTIFQHNLKEKKINKIKREIKEFLKEEKI